MWPFRRRRGLRHASGKDLDALAERVGFKRKRWLWPFRERDVTLRTRVLKAVCGGR